MIVRKLKEETIYLQREARQKVIGFVTAAFGLVAGLAWNDAIKALIEYFFPLETQTIFAKFMYAVVITIVVVIITVYLVRLAGKTETEKT